jgi:hypothetical protein
MQRKQNSTYGTEDEPRKEPGLLAKARARTERELDSLLSTDTSHYAAAALGQSPYIAMGNGVIVVQRKCSNWSC